MKHGCLHIALAQPLPPICSQGETFCGYYKFYILKTLSLKSKQLQNVVFFFNIVAYFVDAFLCSRGRFKQTVV